MRSFFDFQYGFRSSRSPADLLTVVSDRSYWVVNRSEATAAAALDKSKNFNRVSTRISILHSVLFTNLSPLSHKFESINAGVP